MQTESDIFIKELNTIVQNLYSEKIRNLIKDGLLSFKIKLNDTKINNLLNKYNLENFSIHIKLDYGLKTEYCYKDIDIKPKGYWILPNNSREPELLEILRECIMQDTYEPDITHLQRCD